jgi:histone H3/H4
MTDDHNLNQPTLFEPKSVDTERLLLYALGEFQSRGKVLAERELPLDRLRGAFKRASEKFQIEELTDENIAETLEKLGAKVVRKPSFVAKHPFRVTVHEDLSEKAKAVYKETLNDD